MSLPEASVSLPASPRCSLAPTNRSPWGGVPKPAQNAVDALTTALTGAAQRSPNQTLPEGTEIAAHFLACSSKTVPVSCSDSQHSPLRTFSRPALMASKICAGSGPGHFRVRFSKIPPIH